VTIFRILVTREAHLDLSVQKKKKKTSEKEINSRMENWDIIIDKAEVLENIVFA